MFFNKTFTDELSSIKSAFQSTHDKTASLIERMNTKITSKETFEYLVNDPNNFCSVHDALEMDTSMPDDIADKYLEFCESHNSDEVYDYLKRLYSYIQVINLEYTILDIDSEKGYVEYKAIIKVNNKYYSFDYYQSPYWNFKDTVDEDTDLTEVFPKEVTTVIYV